MNHDLYLQHQWNRQAQASICQLFECAYGLLATGQNINALQTLVKQMRDAEKDAIHEQTSIIPSDLFRD
ncbi:hypothetical protein DTO217A2_1913 [Paecilomyces variotii]|nr:hypothetical protein DTO217A2_1913 [Paecilomyces variotii]